MLYRKFLKIAIIHGLHFDEVKAMLAAWEMVPPTEKEFLEVLHTLPKKKIQEYATGKLFTREDRDEVYKDLAWTDIILLQKVKGKVAINIQIGTMLGIKDLKALLKKNYFGLFDEYLVDLFQKYLFNMKDMDAIDLYNYIHRGIDSQQTLHLLAAAKRPDYERFRMTGEHGHELASLVRNAGYMAYTKFEESVNRGSVSDAKDWGNLLIKAAQVKGESKRADLLDQLEQLSVQWEQRTNASDTVELIPDDVEHPDPTNDDLPE